MAAVVDTAVWVTESAYEGGMTGVTSVAMPAEGVFGGHEDGITYFL